MTTAQNSPVIQISHDPITPTSKLIKFKITQEMLESNIKLQNLYISYGEQYGRIEWSKPSKLASIGWKFDRFYDEYGICVDNGHVYAGYNSSGYNRYKDCSSEHWIQIYQLVQ